MIKPYGSNDLVNHIVTEDKLRELESSKNPKLILSALDIVDCYRIADGSLTPINRFMDLDELKSILSTNKLRSGHYFPIPFLHALPENIARKNADCLLIYDQNENLRGYINVDEYFQYDTKIISDFIFNPKHDDHPGVHRFLNRSHHFVAGEVFMAKTTNSLDGYCFSPKETRSIIKKRKYTSVVGFQTRNVPHLAHEYLQRLALEMCDALFIQPIIGWKKADDYHPNIVMSAYQYLKDNFYPKEKIILSGLQLGMYYAGPKEAILHAIIRQNYGCTHFIVGRDHAGVGNHYEKYEAHKLAEEVQPYLDINIIKMKGPDYCKKCRLVVTNNTCAHSDIYHQEISGTNIRNLLMQKQYPPNNWIRKEIVDEILKHEQLFCEK